MVAWSASVLVGLAAGVLSFAYGPGNQSQLQTIAGTLATVAGTLFGMVLTAGSLLASGGRRRLLDNMRVTGHFRVLVRHLLAVAFLWFITMSLCAAALFASNDGILRPVLCGAIGLAATALCETLSAGRRMYFVLNYWGD